jgi:thioredoxin reductase (NADPH)
MRKRQNEIRYNYHWRWSCSASAAIYTSRANLKTLVLNKSAISGALWMIHKIANYPGVPEELSGEELSGEELLGRMKEQAEGFARELLNILSKY